MALLGVIAVSGLTGLVPAQKAAHSDGRAPRTFRRPLKALTESGVRYRLATRAD